MTDDRPSELLGQLPRTRPHRRSTKRPARAANGPASAKPRATDATARPAAETGTAQRSRAKATAKRDQAGPSTTAKRDQAAPSTPRAKRLAQPAQPRGVPAARRPKRPLPDSEMPGRSTPTPILGTAVQAAGELAEIGLALSSRALRRAIERFPRP